MASCFYAIVIKVFVETYTGCFFKNLAKINIGHVVVQACVGKEFPDIRQNKREISLLAWETLSEQ